jgi:hypothetical protein
MLRFVFVKQPDAMFHNDCDRNTISEHRQKWSKRSHSALLPDTSWGDGARANSSAYSTRGVRDPASLPYFAVAAAFAYFLYPAIH